MDLRARKLVDRVVDVMHSRYPESPHSYSMMGIMHGRVWDSHSQTDGPVAALIEFLNA